MVKLLRNTLGSMEFHSGSGQVIWSFLSEIWRETVQDTE